MDNPNTKTGILLICIECGQEFVYPVIQQEDFERRGWSPPKRCPLCRKWKRFANKNREEDGR